MNAWVRVALSALPETEQYALVGRLIDTLAENFDVEFGDGTITKDAARFALFSLIGRQRVSAP